MVKRTRAASVASTLPSGSGSGSGSGASSFSVQDNEHIEEMRPATRRRANNTRAKTKSVAPTSASLDLDNVSSPSSTQTDDTKAVRKLQRKERNRISAQHSRDRKKMESQELRGRLEEAETRTMALVADNERLREENARFKLELDKSSSLQAELSSLKERFEMLERLLLAGAQQALPASIAPAQSTPDSLSAPSQTPNPAPVQAHSRIGSEAHATGMHSLFRSTTSLSSRSGLLGLRQGADSHQSVANASSNASGRPVNNTLPSSTTAHSTISSVSTAAILRPPQRISRQKALTPKIRSTTHSKIYSPAQMEAYLPTNRLSLRDKQRFLLRRQQRHSPPHRQSLQADLLARAKLITMTMIDSMSNSRRS